MPVKVLLVDDHAVVRHGLRLILEATGDLHVVGEASDGREGVEKALALRPDAVVMDLDMPRMNGIEATRAIVAMLPLVKVIILSMYNTQEHVYRAIEAGARGYLLKESAGSEVVSAVRAVARGGRYFGAGVEPGAQLQKGGKSPFESLSRREREIFQHVVEGKTSVEISAILSLSAKSVETYRNRIMVKLAVDDIPALVKFAILNDLLHN